jgi:predicted metalloendopeptidase
LKARILKARANYLSKALRDEWFTFFRKVLNGQSQPEERYRQCIASIDAELGELLGKYFVEIAFPGSSLQDAGKLLNETLSAMRYDLNHLEWMDNVTRTNALKKLDLVDDLIGSPTNPETYSSVEIGVDYFTNVQNAETFAATDRFSTIGTPTDKQSWQMTAPTVNAYYDPTLNEMVFPAGILQQPFFNHGFPNEMNAGGIGMVMGHELTHGFDNQGRLYTGKGVLKNWWEPATSKKFDDKVNCVIQQYSKFSPIPGVNVNGNLTQGENIADMGGIKNAYHAITELLGNQTNAPSIVPHLTRAQLFFVAFAQGWCTKASDEYYRLHAKTDPHSPPMFRVLGPLMNLPAFSTTFNCASGTPMNPKNRCEVW